MLAQPFPFVNNSKIVTVMVTPKTQFKNHFLIQNAQLTGCFVRLLRENTDLFLETEISKKTPPFLARAFCSS
jgi:hypothetical protein